MADINTLARSDKLFPIARAATLVNFARNQGMTDHQIQAIAEQELSINSSPSLTSFKARVVGVVGLFWIPIMSAFVIHKSGNPVSLGQVLAVAAITLAFFVMYVMGTRTRHPAAFATAVLRARTAPLSVDQISVLKDRPELRSCSDTQRLLSEIQDQKRSATPSNTAIAA